MKLRLLTFLLLTGVPLSAQEKDATPAPFDVLIVAPHPDDETIGCAGVTLQAIARGERVGIVVVTQGDAHVRLTAVAAGKPEKELTPADFIQAGVLRQGHTLRAAAALGVPEDAVIFLGYPDSGLGPMYRARGLEPFRQAHTLKSETHAGVRPDYHTARHGRPAPYTRANVIADLAEIVRARRPRAVYVTHESDRHADHQAAFWFVRDALRAGEFSGRFLAFIVHGEPPGRAPDLRVQLTPAELATKRAALLLHQRGVSPVHDYLAPQFARSEEHFWQYPVP